MLIRRRQSNFMRALFLAHVFPRTLDDSMGAFLLQLAEALAAREIEIEAIAPHAQNLAGDETLGATRVHRFHYAPASWERLAYAGTMHELVARGVGNKILFALFNLAFLLKTIFVIRATRPNVLHAHWWLPGGLVAALVSLGMHIPFIVTTHGTDVEMLRRNRWARPFARFVFGRASAITCGSSYMRAQLLELGVADANNVQVIPMPVGSEFQITNYELRITNLILTVARLTKQKSIDTLLDAIALVPNARLKIIGDGPERANLEKQTDDLGLRARVEFLGALPPHELPAHYTTCAVFALPSLREGMGVVFAEALLCGAPVIAANSGGATDIVRDGETGLLVPERDARALANAIEKFLNDRTLAERLATNGATWVRERFTRERVAEQFTRIYQKNIYGT